MVSKKPNSKLNFFQNYTNHINYLGIQAKEDISNIMVTQDFNKQFDIVQKRLLSSLNLFERIRDGHDYFDEVLGATVLPIAACVTSLIFAGLALFEGIKQLVTKVGLADFSSDQDALCYIIISGSAAAIALASFAKSLISLVTRPICTAINGFGEEDKERFQTESCLSAIFDFN